jgi:hypothetical protein
MQNLLSGAGGIQLQYQNYTTIEQQIHTQQSTGLKCEGEPEEEVLENKAA